MSDFDFLERFIREIETSETKEIDPTALVEETEEGDGRMFNYRPRQYDNVEMRRTNLYNILTEITKLESNIINKTVDIIIEMINSGINHRGKLRHALYAICLNKALEPNILTNKELIKMFNIKSKYLSSVSKNIENIKPNYTEKYCSLLSIDKKNITMINNKLNSLNILSNAKISTKTIAVIYYLFLKERKLSDVCKICNVGISSVKSFYKLIQ